MTRPITLSAAHPVDEQYVLHARPLRPGAALEGSSRFRDDQWRLDAAILQSHSRVLMLNFESVPARYRVAARELFYAMLSGDLPLGEPRPTVASIRTMFGHVAAFLTWLDTRPVRAGQHTKPALVDLSGHDLLGYQRYLMSVRRNAATRGCHRGSVRYLWRYRSVLAADRLLFDPHHVEGWAEPRGRASAENATDRIPEAVHGPLLVWALRFVDDFSEDILAAADLRRHLHDPARRPGAGVNSGASEKLRRRLADHLARRQPLPGYQGSVNINHLAKESGCDRSVCVRLHAEIDVVAAVVGVSAHAYFDIPITGKLDGRPWIEGVAADYRVDDGLARLARMMQAATCIVLSFLSGMRDAEVKHLRRGCLRGERDERGQTYRWKVTSLAFKGEDDPAGVEATWVVAASAARAIEILERLQPAGTDLLFTSLDQGPGGSARRERGEGALTTSATNGQLNDFVRWVNDYCAAHGRTDGISQVNGKPWRLTTRQFRRTLAWFIARRPGGAIAGAIAYRHQAIQMFEGYAGTSESGFRAEVESEQALARGEHLLAMIDQHEHKNLAGPAADEAARRLEEFGQRARFEGTVITDPHRLDRLMQRNDPDIHVGKYATCVHKHATALCRQHRDSGGQLRPDLGGCKPLLCRNVALTTSNIHNLREEMARIDQEINARPLPPPLMLTHLRARHAEIAAFLGRHNQHEETP